MHADLTFQAGDMKVWCILTVIRPAGVEEVVPIRRKGHIQDAPAYIPGLDTLEFMEAAISAVIQSDCLVCVSRNQAELWNTVFISFLDYTSLSVSIDSSLYHGKQVLAKHH